MNIHLHKKKTLAFVCIVLIKIFGALFIYVNVGTYKSESTSFLRQDRYEYSQQKKLHILEEVLKSRTNVDKNIYDLSKVSK